MSQIKITIAICTHNRSADVDECLAALIPQITSEVEVIVCDSASSPDHAAALRGIVAAYAGVRFIRLETPGLSRARNAILAESRGTWFAMLDDDAVPAADWGQVALSLADQLRDPIGIVGGAVHPVLPKQLPPTSLGIAQIGPRWMQLISMVEVEGEGDQTEKPRVVGANMWIRTDLLREVGGFPENLGRVGTSLLSGEEKLVLNTLLGQGWRIWYTDRLEVGHKLHPDRLTKAWAAKRAYWDGISDRRISSIMKVDVSPLTVAAIAVKLAGITPLCLFDSPKQEFFLRHWYARGWLRESLGGKPN